MKKQDFVIRMRDGFETVTGYVTDNGNFGIDKRFGGVWYVTDIPTGLAIDHSVYDTRKEAVADIERLEGIVAEQGLKEKDTYIKAVQELNEFKGIKTESEDKTMAKTNSKDTKAKTETARLEGENMALRKEIEMLKAQIQALEPKAEAPKVEAPKRGKTKKAGIDEFDVDKYLATRDNVARITPELVKALENTKGLTVERKGKDGWLYVSGKTEADTKDRKDVFKAMGFRWSAPEKAWFLAPYPLRSRQSWGAKKARMATA